VVVNVIHLHVAQVPEQLANPAVVLLNVMYLECVHVPGCICQYVHPVTAFVLWLRSWNLATS
jgi:hypothetical protein